MKSLIDSYPLPDEGCASKKMNRRCISMWPKDKGFAFRMDAMSHILKDLDDVFMAKMFH